MAWTLSLDLRERVALPALDGATARGRGIPVAASRLHATHRAAAPIRTAGVRSDADPMCL